MTFEEFLAQTRADPDTLQQALRLHLSELTDDLPPREMREHLYRVTEDKAELATQLAILERDSALAESAALAYFEDAWNDETRQASIRASFEYAKSKLPVIETGIIALVAMYAMYLVATGGVTEETDEETRAPDGSIVRRRTVKREPFAPIGALITKLFGV